MRIMKKFIAVILPMFVVILFAGSVVTVQAKQSNTVTITAKDLGVKEILSAKYSIDSQGELLKKKGFTLTTKQDKLIITSSNKGNEPFVTYENRSEINVLAKDLFGHTYDFTMFVNIDEDGQSFELVDGGDVDNKKIRSFMSATFLMNKFLAVQEVRYDGKKITATDKGLKSVELIYDNVELRIEINSLQPNSKIYEIDVVGLRNGQQVTETLRFYMDIFGIAIFDIEGERLIEEPHVESSGPKYIITPDLTVMLKQTYEVVDENLFYYFTIDKHAAMRGHGFIGGVTLKDLQQFFKQDGTMDELWGINKGSDILAVRKKDLALMAVNQINGAGQLNPEIKRYAPYVVTLPNNLKKWTKIITGESYVVEKVEGRQLYIRPTDDYGLINATKKESSALMSIYRNSSSLGFYKLKNYNGKIYLQGAY